MPAQDRANIVCTECHSRKVKCDLQKSLDGVCRNCRRSHQPCIQRSGLRKRRAITKSHEGASRSSQAQSPSISESCLHDMTRPVSAVTEQGNGGSESAPLTQRDNAFVSHCSMAYYEEPTEMTVAESAVPDSSNMRGNVLGFTQAAVLPRPALVRAWMDAYQTHFFHHCPVTEKKDIPNAGVSILLQLSLCLVGNLMRHDSSGPNLAKELYEKVKVLIAVNHEQDCVTTLKALCLLSCWSGKASNPISLDDPWHWIGVAARLILQMGLHREQTYAKLPNKGCLRRLFWQVHNSETLQIACWGRPGLLRRKDFDVKLLALEDFEFPTLPALVFLESTKLCTIMSSISELQLARQPIQAEQFVVIETALCDWTSHLPEELRLYDEIGRRKSYSRPIAEMFIQYFVTIIFAELLKYRVGRKPWRVSIQSLVAASCAVALYDEIYCRDEAIHLPSITGFFCLAVALPLIHHVPQSAPKQRSRKRELDILRSIMTRLQDRYGDAEWVLRMLSTLERRIQQTMDENSGSSTILSGLQEPHAYATQLFSFPPTFCDNMDLLQLTTTTPAFQSLTDNSELMQDWPTDDTGFDFSFLDLFGLDFGDDTSIFDENGGSGLNMDERMGM